MDPLQIYDIVNACETAEQLEKAILLIADKETGLIQGRSRSFNAEKMASYVKHVIEGRLTPNVLTRSYGIRQQAIYISYYTKGLN